MSAYRFFIDQHDRVTRGDTVALGLSAETFRVSHLPQTILTDADICWPDGERWGHHHYVGEIDAPADTTEQAA